MTLGESAHCPSAWPSCGILGEIACFGNMREIGGSLECWPVVPVHWVFINSFSIGHCQIGASALSEGNCISSPPHTTHQPPQPGHLQHPPEGCGVPLCASLPAGLLTCQGSRLPPVCLVLGLCVRWSVPRCPGLDTWGTLLLELALLTRSHQLRPPIP